MKHIARILVPVAGLICLALLAGALLAHAGNAETDSSHNGPSSALRLTPAAIAATQTPTPVPPPYYAPSNVTIEGNDTALFGSLVTLTAHVSPITATIPFTYHWQATGRPDAVLFPRAVPRADFYAAWDSLGTKTITVTVSNIAGSAVATRTVLVIPALTPPVAPIPGPWVVSVLPYVTQQENSIGVQVGPPTVTLPITYTWHVTDMEPIVHASSTAPGDGIQLFWRSPGRKTLTVIASNIAGAITLTMDIHVRALNYLPIIIARPPTP